MRRLSAILLAAAVVATAAGAATIDTRLLVLQKPDVPATFRLDRDASRYWPNAALARSAPEIRKLLTSSGRISGYTATYENGVPAIVSAAHLFRKGAGAHIFYAGENAQQQALNAERVKRGVRAYRHESLVLGDEASLYRSTQAPKFTLVLWRTGRVVGSLSTWGLGRDRTVALARVQQRRVENTLG